MTGRAEADELARLRRALERERQARREAEDIAEEATARLFATLQRLEQEHAAMRDLTAAATHDIKNPLASIIGFVQLLQDPRLPESMREDVIGRLVGATTYTRDLIDGLLDVLGASVRGGEREPLDLGRLLDDAAADLQARHAGVVVHQRVRARCLGHATDTRRLFDNLLENAARYAGTDPVVITVDAVEEPDGSVVVRVGDNGGGIPEADRDRVFGLFQRGSAQSGTRGSGVGLAVAQRIAQAAEGDLWLADDPPSAGGAAFMVRLPAA